jgi:hypothetical protein
MIRRRIRGGIRQVLKTPLSEMNWEKMNFYIYIVHVLILALAIQMFQKFRNVFCYILELVMKHLVFVLKKLFKIPNVFGENHLSITD